MNPTINVDLPKSGPSPDSHLHLRKKQGKNEENQKIEQRRSERKGENMESLRFKGNYITKIRPEFQEMEII